MQMERERERNTLIKENIEYSNLSPYFFIYNISSQKGGGLPLK